MTTLETRQVEYADAKIDLTGLEFSIGVIFNSGQGGGQQKRSGGRESNEYNYAR